MRRRKQAARHAASDQPRNRAGGAGVPRVRGAGGGEVADQEPAGDRQQMWCLVANAGRPAGQVGHRGHGQQNCRQAGHWPHSERTPGCQTATRKPAASAIPKRAYLVSDVDGSTVVTAEEQDRDRGRDLPRRHHGQPGARRRGAQPAARHPGTGTDRGEHLTGAPRRYADGRDPGPPGHCMSSLTPRPARRAAEEMLREILNQHPGFFTIKYRRDGLPGRFATHTY